MTVQTFVVLKRIPETGECIIGTERGRLHFVAAEYAARIPERYGLTDWQVIKVRKGTREWYLPLEPDLSVPSWVPRNWLVILHPMKVGGHVIWCGCAAKRKVWVVEE